MPVLGVEVLNIEFDAIYGRQQQQHRHNIHLTHLCTSTSNRCSVLYGHTVTQESTAAAANAKERRR